MFLWQTESGEKGVLRLDYPVGSHYLFKVEVGSRLFRLMGMEPETMEPVTLHPETIHTMGLSRGHSFGLFHHTTLTS